MDRRDARTLSLLASVALLALAACAPASNTSEDGSTDGEDLSAPTTSGTTQTPDTGTVQEDVSVRYPIDEGLQPFIVQAIDDVVNRTGADREAVHVYNAYLVTWPDASMGCPDPDIVYVPAVNDGSIIELELQGALHRYHTGGDGLAPFLCEEPSGDETVVNDTPIEGTDYLEGTPLELQTPIEKYPDETVPPPGFDE